MLHCPNCGASIKSDSKFCMYCGAKIDDTIKARVEIVSTVDDKARVAEEGRKAEEAKYDSRTAFISAITGGIVGLVLLILAAIQPNENVALTYVAIAFGAFIIGTKPIRSRRRRLR